MYSLVSYFSRAAFMSCERRGSISRTSSKIPADITALSRICVHAQSHVVNTLSRQSRVPALCIIRHKHKRNTRRCLVYSSLNVDFRCKQLLRQIRTHLHVWGNGRGGRGGKGGGWHLLSHKLCDVGRLRARLFVYTTSHSPACGPQYACLHDCKC